jgi:hypothetical protein
MEVKLENSDIKALLLDSFCNGGLTELYHCDCYIDWENQENNDNYVKAKALLIKEGKGDSICQEDVYLKVVEEFGVIFKDHNESFKVDGEYTEDMKLTFDMAKENLQKTLDDDDKGWFLGQIKQVIPEYDNADAWTMDKNL